MKRLIAVMLALALLLTACAQGNADDLMQNVPAKAVDVLPDMIPVLPQRQISECACSRPVWRKGRIP